MRYYADSVLFISSIIQYNIAIEQRRRMPMTARERILALRLLEKQERLPEYAKRIGIQVCILEKGPKKMEDKNV